MPNHAIAKFEAKIFKYRIKISIKRKDFAVINVIAGLPAQTAGRLQDSDQFSNNIALPFQIGLKVVLPLVNLAKIIGRRADNELKKISRKCLACADDVVIDNRSIGLLVEIPSNDEGMAQKVALGDRGHQGCSSRVFKVKAVIKSKPSSGRFDRRVLRVVADEPASLGGQRDQPGKPKTMALLAQRKSGS
jgi:hypothetical protein